MAEVSVETCFLKCCRFLKFFNPFLTFTFGGKTSGTWGGVIGREPVPFKDP